VRSHLVIGADGIYSTVASRVSAANVHHGRHATAVLYAYWAGAAVDGYHWFYRQGVSVGAIPTNDAVCVFVSVPAARLRAAVRGDVYAAYHRLLAEAAPAFYESLRGTPEGDHVRGFGGATGFIRASHGPGWALVGDAGYFKDPLTAHGITDALRDAELLARAAAQDTEAAFRQYEMTRNELARELFDVTDRIASFDWDEPQLRQLHRALSREMSRETRALAELEPVPWPSPLDNERPAV
jgi:menaquinone-9 beta-reductase